MSVPETLTFYQPTRRLHTLEFASTTIWGTQNSKQNKNYHIQHLYVAYVVLRRSYGWESLGSNPRRVNLFLHYNVQTCHGAHSASRVFRTGVISLGQKRQLLKVNRSHPSVLELRNGWSYTFASLYAFMAWTRKTSALPIYNPCTINANCSIAAIEWLG